MDNIEYVSKILNDQVGFGNSGAINDFNASLLGRIDNFKEFLLFNYKKYDWMSNHALMLTFPQIWISFSMEDWKELISMNPERSFISDYGESKYSGIYSDLTFLYRVLGIDFLELLEKFDLVTVETKANCKSCFYSFSALFKNDRERLEEDFDMFSDMSLEKIDYHSERLIQGGFPRIK